MLPWFQNGQFPLYLAPMAGVTDSIFRQICKAEGADVVVTEFVSAEGIMYRNERTARYLEFDEVERPLGVQLFGADPERMAEAARQVIEWRGPDFIDINFGCPAKKVVAKQGGSALLKDCPLMERVAETIVKAVAPVPVTAKMRIGWDANSINATTAAKRLEDAGIQAIAVHGRTRAQAYRGEANWDVIAEVVQSVRVPVIGNGDVTSGADVKRRRQESGVAGIMIGRAAMSSPWIFNEAKHYLATGEEPAPAPPERRWDTLIGHARTAVAQNAYGGEKHTIMGLRSRMMAYTRGLLGGRRLRGQLASVASLAEIEDMRARYFDWLAQGALEAEPEAEPEPQEDLALVGE
jgi:tRNA-dihydrouridine synthase B